MIKFFRHIRRRLLAENRFTRYLLYAMGEIVLVVIGILIALQINNWNEDRKTRERELATLKELKANLLMDIEDFETNIRWHRVFIHSSEVVLNALRSGAPYHDSLSIHLARIPANPIFMPTTSAYQNLKMSGFELIGNDSLRRELQGLYEARYAYTAKTTGAAYDHDQEQFGRFYQKEMSSYIMNNKAHPVDFRALQTNQEFMNLVAHKMARDQHSIIPNYEERIMQITRIVELIDQELENQ